MRARSRLSSPSLLARLLTISPDPGDLGGAGGCREQQQRRQQGQEGLGQDNRVTSPHCTDPALASPGALGGLCTCPLCQLPPCREPLSLPFSLSLPEKPDSPSLRVSTGSRNTRIPCAFTAPLSGKGPLPKVGSGPQCHESPQAQAQYLHAAS